LASGVGRKKAKGKSGEEEARLAVTTLKYPAHMAWIEHAERSSSALDTGRDFSGAAFIPVQAQRDGR